MSQKKRPKYIFATGGTGGHLFSAQKLKKLFDQEVEVVFVGKGLKNNPFFQSKSNRFYSISSSPIKKGIKLFSSLFFLFLGGLQSLYILLKEKPDLVVGFGSYHTFPFLLLAKFLGKKMLLFEANCLVGQVNRVIASKKVPLACQFPLISAPSNKKVVYVKPYPFESTRAPLEKKEEKKTLLVFGGSQGANKISTATLQMALSEKNSYKILHVTGSKKQQEMYQKKYEKALIDAEVFSFVEDMSALYKRADIVLCRGGGLTIAELLYYHLPAVIIPYPQAKDNHQQINAEFFVKVSNGAILKQKDLSAEKISKKLHYVLQKGPIKHSYSNKGSAHIKEIIQKLCKKTTII